MMMRKILYFVLVFVLFTVVPCSILAKASFSLLGCNYATVSINYESVDVHNNPITLSAVLYYPTNSGTSESNIKSCNYVFLNNHATITDNASSPSGGQSAMGQLYWMTTDNALVVNPDYIGFGGTRDVIHPYMCQTLTARNVVDCVKAAIADAKNRGKLADNYYTINCGYSQGGGVTMAVARYLETEADEATQRTVNLRSSICGAGCYNQTQIFDIYEAMEDIAYPIYLPYTIQGMMQAYGEGCMRGLSLQDCFTQKFLNSGILATLNAKTTDVDALNSQLKAAMGGKCGFYDIVNADYSDHSSALYRCLHKALAKNDLIDDDWTPKHPITFYHYNQDEVVPYAGTTLASTKWASTGMVTFKNAEYMTDYGDWNIAKVKYNNLKQNHRDYGTCFYLLVFDGQLTSAPATDGFISTSAVEGKDRNAIDCEIADGQWSLVRFNSPVDGYYFGADATRYKAVPSSQTDGSYVVSLGEMPDADDFMPGQYYLIQPKGAVSQIVSMTAGVQTVVDNGTTPLLSSNIAVQSSLTMVGDKSYATLYSPFDVQIPDGTDAYAVRLQDDKMQLMELTEGIIPACTGVVLRSTNTGTMLLHYTPEGVERTLSDLSGTLMEMENPGNVLVLGTNASGVLGFYRYTGVLAAGKAYYQLPSTASAAKGFQLDFGYADGITDIFRTSSSAEEVFSLDGRKQNAAQSGINIVRLSDGSVIKIISKK